MSNKKFILNADDFGLSNDFNKAVVDGYNNGFLKSASLCANGEAFDSAVNEIIPECPNLGIGVHLNIMEGSSLADGEKFNNSYLKLITQAKNPSVLSKIEKEFRLQIEKTLNFSKIDHLDSHVHTHAIPEIFEMTCKLAQEYNVKQIRTQFEKFYTVPDVLRHINFKYPANLLKIALLNSFTLKNKETIKKYGLKTNDYIIGVGYTGMMDDKTLYHGLCAINEDAVVEALIHPCSYGENIKNNHSTEFITTQNIDLQDKIQRLGFEITNYKN